MNIKVGQVYTNDENKFPNFIIMEIEPIVTAVFVDDRKGMSPWELNLGCIESGGYRLLSKLEKAMK